MEMNARESGKGAIPGSMAHGGGWGLIPPEENTEGEHGCDTLGRAPRMSLAASREGRRETGWGVWG